MLELLAQITYDPIQRWGPVSPHGVGTAGGFLLGAWLMARRAEPRGIPRAEVYNAVTWGAIGALIGARLFYVLPRLDQFSSVVDIFRVWEGGLTMFGGFVGGLILGLGYLWRRKFDIPQAMEAAAPGFVVGVSVGRIGDIIIADHLGDPTNFFLGYRIPSPPAELAPGYGPPHFLVGEVYHHTALYDLFGALLLLGVIYLVGRRRPPAPTLFAVFSIWYGLQRFAVDFTRNNEIIDTAFLWFSGSQWAGLGFALGGTFLLYRARSGPGPASDAAPVSSATPRPTSGPTGLPSDPTAQGAPSDPPAVEGAGDSSDHPSPSLPVADQTAPVADQTAPVAEPPPPEPDPPRPEGSPEPGPPRPEGPAPSSNA